MPKITQSITLKPANNWNYLALIALRLSTSESCLERDGTPATQKKSKPVLSALVR